MLRPRSKICAGWESAGRRARFGGPDKGGPFAPYVQSKRRALYLAAWRRLLRTGRLFPCRCSRKDLATALSAPHERARQAAASSTAMTMSRTMSRSIPAPAGIFMGGTPQLPGPTAERI